MYRLLRREDQDFPQDELLYYRFKDHGYTRNGAPTLRQIIKEQLRFPDTSVNREKYSQPEDVLWPEYFNWGVLAFPVRAVLVELMSGDGRTFRFVVQHDPLWNNYSHSEIRIHESGSRMTKKPTKAVRREFRGRVSGEACLVKRPHAWPSPGGGNGQ